MGIGDWGLGNRNWGDLRIARGTRVGRYSWREKVIEFFDPHLRNLSTFDADGMIVVVVVVVVMRF